MVENIYTQNRSMCLGLPNWLLESANIVLMIPQSPAELSLGLGTLKRVDKQTQLPCVSSLTRQPRAQGPSSPRGWCGGQKGPEELVSGLWLPHKRKGLEVFVSEHKMKQTKNTTSTEPEGCSRKV